jgi:hypothetical protein
MATILALQEQLRMQSAAKAVAAGGIPPLITVTTQVAAPAGNPPPAPALTRPVPGSTPAAAPVPAVVPPAPAVIPGILHTPAPGVAAGMGQSVTFNGNASAPAASAPSTPLTADKWYAVVIGRTPGNTGVYKDYTTVAPMVVGVSGAVFRGSFATKAEADSYLASVASIPVLTTPKRNQKWYVVVVGQDPQYQGVYNNWPKVASKVLGVSGCIYQGGFRTQPEAKVYLAQCLAPAPQVTPPVPASCLRPLM